MGSHRFDGRVALVTGAGRGQGRSHALRLAAEGADVVVTDLTDDVAETAALVRQTGRQAVEGRVDVCDHEALAAFVAEAVAGLGRLDVAVANAGVVLPGPTLEVSQESWQRTLEVNLTGAWNTCRAVLPHLVAGGRGGAIVITGSTQAFRPTAGVAAYAVSKHGVVGLAKALALEFAPYAIRVNSVHPTTVATPMLESLAPEGADMARHFAHVNALPTPWVEPRDVSDAVAFLASDEARYITGAALPVDAGALLLGPRRSDQVPV